MKKIVISKFESDDFWLKSVKLITFGRSCVGVAFILPFKDMLKFIVLYLLLFSLLSFARHVPGTVLGVLFPCTPAKQSFRIAAGQSPFLVLRFGFCFAFASAAWAISSGAGSCLVVCSGQLGETGAPLPFPRCWSAWLFFTSFSSPMNFLQWGIIESVTLQVKSGTLEIIQRKGNKLFPQYAVCPAVYLQPFRCFSAYRNGCLFRLALGCMVALSVMP